MLLEVLLIVISSMFIVLIATDNDIQKKFLEYGIVPDVIPAPPIHSVEAIFYDRIVTYPGKVLRHNHTIRRPELTYPGDPNKLYTLYMLGQATYDREFHLAKWMNYTVTPTYHQFPLWIVYNIPGPHWQNGTKWLSYTAIGQPVRENATEKIVLLIYEQKKNLTLGPLPLQTFEHSHLPDPILFTLQDWIRKYDLIEPPFAGTFFISEWNQTMPLEDRIDWKAYQTFDNSYIYQD